MRLASNIAFSLIGVHAFLAVTLVACGSNGGSTPRDSGVPEMDGGHAGSGHVDGGGDPPDAGIDAGNPEDAATMQDSGAPADAGTDAATVMESICDDGMDNDGDGSEDCADSDCADVSPCGSEACDDSFDNDGDGDTDCNDDDCAHLAICGGIEADCDDSADDDLDGDTDCDDDDCAHLAICGGIEAVCDDSADDDLDGDTDCDDDDCAHLAICGGVETNCDDTIDDDLDGSTDCDDSDCGCRDCFLDGACTTASGLTPNVVIVLDYSTSLNSMWSGDQTRYEALVEALVTTIENPGSFLGRAHLALIRFAHDPEPASSGTTVVNETTGITDGQAVDVVFDDAEGDYLCTMNVRDALLTTPPPMMGSLFGLGTWTKGAMDRAAALIQQTKAAHPGEDRPYAILVVTDGAWTGIDGTTTLSPANEDPALTAADLFDNQQIPTYAVVFAGDALAQMAGDALAAAGGTTASYDDIAQADAAMLGLCMP